MAEKKQYDLVLLRYAPDAITDEFATIGVLLLPSDVAQPPSAVHLRFTRDWRRVRCLDPDADIEMLAALEADFRAQLTRGAVDRATLMSKLQDYCSNGIRFTAAKACAAEDPQAEIETLARMYLERPRAAARDRSARQAIFGRMRDAFEEAGVWGLMIKKIAAAEFTHPGDPLKIDCGYNLPTADGARPTASSVLPSTIRLFHAVALANDIDAAKVLAFSFPLLRDGLRDKQRARAELTAITEDGLDTTDPAIAFALATLQRSDIAVATTADLPRLADRAREELRA